MNERGLLSLATALVCLLTACEGQMPISDVGQPLVPSTAEMSLEDINLPNGSLTSGLAGDNLPVTTEYLALAVDKMLAVFFSLNSFVIEINTTPGVSADGIIDVERENLKLSGRYTNETYRTGSYRYETLFSAALNDYTVNGDQYCGGGLAIKMVYTDHLNAMDAAVIETRVTGRLELGGTYIGEIVFNDFQLKTTAWQISYEGDIQVTVDGTQHSYHVERNDPPGYY